MAVRVNVPVFAVQRVKAIVQEAVQMAVKVIVGVLAVAVVAVLCVQAEANIDNKCRCASKNVKSTPVFF